ncbi:hypothetical protein [Mastigocoleus testarum]|nr:hypothetical protein [Mastigocoleus testarum]
MEREEEANEITAQVLADIEFNKLPFLHTLVKNQSDLKALEQLKI